MVKFINKLTGTAMYVADERKDEYLSAGHKLANGVSSDSGEQHTVAGAFGGSKKLAGIQKRAEVPVKPEKKSASKKSGQ